MTNTHLINNEMNPLMSGDSPKRFKEEDENNLKIEEKEKIKLNGCKDDGGEDDKQEAVCCKYDKNNLDNIKSTNSETSNQQSKIIHKEDSQQEPKEDSQQEPKEDSQHELKEDSQQEPKEDLNKTEHDTKPTFNIFQFDKPKTDQAKPSPFLFEKNEVKEEEKIVPFVVSEEEEIDHIFKEKCCFYKFFKKWEKIGYGTVYITREKENNRLIFFREGTMSKLIDLLLNFDCKPYKKQKGVGFINFKEVDGKIIKENVLLSFDSQLLIDNFYEIIRN